ncbi:YozQ family protein [Niallia sp. Krafla_26]|uniref:YozQ family protein n=1 Tax=Niallia sp. Krafla_26 TaxID=3064703 RepID=UPI003D171039
MSQNEKKEFKSVTKIYDSSDYNKKDEVSKGLATTHEQVSDTYMVGDMLTHAPENQDREGNKK